MRVVRKPQQLNCSTRHRRRVRASRVRGLPSGHYLQYRRRGAVAQQGEHLNGIEGVGSSSPPNSTNYGYMQTDVTSLDSKLGEAADDPTYIFTEPRFGYRMWKGEMGEARPSATP